MRILTLAEVQQMGPGETVPAFRAQIKEVKDFYRGTQKQSGDPFSTQKLIVMDGTAIMTVKLWDHPEFTKQWQQTWVVFESGQSKKDGSLIGMKVKDDDYRGRVTRLVEVKESATITQAQPGTVVSAPQQAPATMPPPQTALAPAPAATMPTPAPVAAPAAMPPPTQERPPVTDYEPQRPTSKNGPTPQQIRESISEFQERMNKTANAGILIYKAVAYMAEEVHRELPEIEFSNAEIHTWARGYMMGAEKGCMIHGLPTGKIMAWLKKPDEKEGA